MDKTPEQIESEARAQGWVPKDEFQGPPENWKDATEFIEVGEKSAPILSARLKKLEERDAAREAELARLRAASEEFRTIANKSIEKSKRERDEAIAELNKQREEGISEGDGKKVVNAERQIEALKAEGQPSQEDWNQRAIQWARENSWYNMNSGEYNEEKRIFADGISDIITSELPHLRNDPVAYFKELSRRVDEKFEERNANRDTSTVDRGGGKPPPKSDRSFDSLPDEAKQGFEEMKFLMPNLTEEEYLKNYTWE